jgi:hypothetical protein
MSGTGALSYHVLVSGMAPVRGGSACVAVKEDAP